MQSNESNILTVLQVRDREAFVFTQYQNSSRPPLKHKDSTEKMKELREKAYSGKLSTRAAKRMTKALNILVEATPKRKIFNPYTRKMTFHRLTFLTLTIHSPERNITAKEAYQTCLLKFLRWMTRTEGARLYVWKAEKQKRGQIHYHIVTDAWIMKTKISEKWNNLQSAAGYLDHYYKKHKHINAPSTEIHRVRHVNQIAAYLSAYFKQQKNDKEGTEGKVWDCSYNLKNAKYYTTEIDTATQKNIEKGIEKGEVKRVELEHVTVFQFIKYPAKYYLSKFCYDEMKKHYSDIYESPPWPPEKEKYKEIEIAGALN